MAQPVNPDDEIFWHQVREAYNQVVVQTGTEITIEVNDRTAQVSSGIEPDEIHVIIWDNNPKQRELNVV